MERISLTPRQAAGLKTACRTTLLFALLVLWSLAVFAADRPATGRTTTVTYTRDIAPLMQNNCVLCHRPDAAGPFSLLESQDVRKRARQIAEVLESRSMPPWKPVADFGHFQDERRLRPEEISLFRAWVDGGCAEGKPDDLPAPPEFPGGWQLGEPDLVLRVSKRFAVPAEGPDLYQYFAIPSGLKEPRLVRAIEFKSRTPKLVHHATAFIDTSGVARELDGSNPAAGYERSNGPGFSIRGSLGGWGPGATARQLPPGHGKLLHARSDVVLQVHYHPSGKPEYDQPELAIYFADARASRFVVDLLVANMQLKIPAGAERHHHHAEYTLPVETMLLDATPHMHLLGREVKAVAHLPDGKTEPLIWIRDWDFNWHDHYSYAKPMVLPPGTRIELDVWYDNSAANPANPHSPPKIVRWGEPSTDEMGVCYFQVTCERVEDIQQLVDSNEAYIARQTSLISLKSR